MTVIPSLKVTLSEDQVLERLPLSSRAFSTRPAPALIADILNSIETEGLVVPRASYGIHDIDRIDGPRLTLDDGGVLVFEESTKVLQTADQMLAAAWSVGSRISTAVSEAYSQKRYLHGFLMHEIASLMLFQLGEKLFDRLCDEAAAKGMNIGRAVSPGDAEMNLSMQESVLGLSRAGQIGITLGRTGALSPMMSVTTMAAVGQQVRLPGSRWSCEHCNSRDHCRLRRKRAA